MTPGAHPPCSGLSGRSSPFGPLLGSPPSRGTLPFPAPARLLPGRILPVLLRICPQASPISLSSVCPSGSPPALPDWSSSHASLDRHLSWSSGPSLAPPSFPGTLPLLASARNMALPCASRPPSSLPSQSLHQAPQLLGWIPSPHLSPCLPSSFFRTPWGIFSLYPFQTVFEFLPYPLAIFSPLKFQGHLPGSLQGPSRSPLHSQHCPPPPLLPLALLSGSPPTSVGPPPLPYPLQPLPSFFFQSFLSLPLPPPVPPDISQAPAPHLLTPGFLSLPSAPEHPLSCSRQEQLQCLAIFQEARIFSCDRSYLSPWVLDLFITPGTQDWPTQYSPCHGWRGGCLSLYQDHMLVCRVFHSTLGC